MADNKDILQTNNGWMKGAEFSECGKYRYKLWRAWDRSKPLAMCIGLNPSKANTVKNDNTIDILIRVLRQLGYGGFYMMNLFANSSLRYTKEMRKMNICCI